MVRRPRRSVVALNVASGLWEIAVRALDCFPCRLRSHQAHGYVNAADDQHTSSVLQPLRLLRRQFSVAGIDLARFQRTSKVPIIQPAVAEIT